MTRLKRLLAILPAICLIAGLSSCSRQPDVVMYDGTGISREELIMDSAYEFPEYDIVDGFDLSYQSGYDGRMTELRINDGSMTYGDVVDQYQAYFEEDQKIAQNEYIEILGFSAVCVTPDTLSFETKSTFSRKDIVIEQAESFDIIYFLSVPEINGFFTTDRERMLDVLGRPRFAAVSWLDDKEYRIDYFWDMGNDRYLTILESGAIRFQSGEFLQHTRPMFEPFLESEETP